MKARSFWLGVFTGVVASLLIGLFAVPALGLFEMTSTGPSGFLDWWGNTNLHGSLRWRAPAEKVPASADPSQGLSHYKSTCLQCHGAPGVASAEWSHNLQPTPPSLWEKKTQRMSDGELFYIVSGGVRMTGMPAFGPEHSQEEIWDIVAFIRRLNALSAEQKSELQTAAEQYEHAHHHQHGPEKSQGHAPVQEKK